MEIKASLGTAQALGLTDARVDAAATAAHFMVGEECGYSCAFCAQGRDSSSSRRYLSRVSWPSYPIERAVEELVRAHRRGDILRACLQVVHGGNYRVVLERFFHLLHQHSQPVPVSVNGVVDTLSDAGRLFALGAERIGLALDAATPELFGRYKRRSPADWVGRVELLQELAAGHPGRISTHLIIGLGETERDALELVQLMTDAGVSVALFAFTPVRGTPLEDHPQPPMDQYRRIQLASHLISRGRLQVHDIVFGEWEHVLSIPGAALDQEALQGEPFRTTGCWGCNRPYYNERPGQEPYNYPRPLTPAEARHALRTAGCLPGAGRSEVAES